MREKSLQNYVLTTLGSQKIGDDTHGYELERVEEDRG